MSLHEFGRIQERLKAVADPVGFLTNLFAHAPVGFAVWNADGTPLLTNAAFMEMFRSEPPPGYNVLRDDLAADDPAQESLVEVYKAGVRASELVAQILAFGRPQEPLRKVVNPQPVVEEALRLLRASLPAMVEIRREFAADLPPIEADLTQVHQAIMNLATNAAHAMGERGGSLDVRLGVATVTDDLARASADLREGRYVVLSVADDGCGIERSILPRIFEPFFTTKGPGRGSGLGLSVVHGIMKAHQGAVTVYSEPGKGTTFRLYFPAAPGSAAETNVAGAPLLRGRGEHILHVDDEEALGFLLKRLLERLGYRVTGHLHPEQALQDFRSRPQAFDAVITDHAMPTMSGVDLAERILQIRADIPVVMMSGYFRPGEEAAARRAGVRALLLKPGSLEELGQVLHQLLDKG